MSIFDSIGDAFKSAGNSIADTANKAADGVANVGQKAVGGVTDVANKAAEVGTKAALATGDIANVAGHGINSLMHGDLGQASNDLAVTFASLLGVTQPQLVAQYQDSIGQASLWAQQQQQNVQHTPPCYSAYREKVKSNLAANGLTWTDSMDAPLRQSAQSLQLPLNYSC